MREVIGILTYNDLAKLGDNEKSREDFITQLVNEHKSSKAYQKAKEAQKYYDGENPTICKYEKILYDFRGRAHMDKYTANHKIASNFFGTVVDQEVSYLLRNGITFSKGETINTLGRDIHRRVADIVTSAAIEGVAYGFWNNDHLECFHFADSESHPGFAPLCDEDTGQLMAGVRYWQIDTTKPMHYVLYEPDGITEYAQKSGEDMQIVKEKYSYKTAEVVQASTGVVVAEEDAGNYPGFPIVPFQYKTNGMSELQGKRNTLDALDLVTSNMVNNVDEGNLIYWVLTNCGGMDDLDDAQFLEQLRITHVVHADGDGTEDGAKVEAHSIESPYAATQEAIEKLEKRLYKDFRAFDENLITAGNQTATAITSSYTSLDLKVDKLEDRVSDFIEEIMKLAGVEDEPSYTRNRIINKAEETETVLMGAEYYDTEYITKKLLTINGDADQFREILKRRESEEVTRFRDMQNQLKQLKNDKDEDGEEE